MDYNKYSFPTYLILILFFAISAVFVLGFVISDSNKCENGISEQLCVITNINILMRYVRENIKYMEIEITFCYESICNSDIKTVSDDIYKNITNIVCWYKIDNLATLTINNIKLPCDKYVTITISIVAGIIFMACLSLLRLFGYKRYKPEHQLYLPLWYKYCIDKIIGNEKIIYENDKLYQSGIKL